MITIRYVNMTGRENTMYIEQDGEEKVFLKATYSEYEKMCDFIESLGYQGRERYLDMGLEIMDFKNVQS